MLQEYFDLRGGSRGRSNRKENAAILPATSHKKPVKSHKRQETAKAIVIEEETIDRWNDPTLAAQDAAKVGHPASGEVEICGFASFPRKA
jgi:hypothetical protein